MVLQLNKIGDLFAQLLPMGHCDVMTTGVRHYVEVFRVGPQVRLSKTVHGRCVGGFGRETNG